MASAEIPEARMRTPPTSAPTSGGGDQAIAPRHSVAVARDPDQDGRAGERVEAKAGRQGSGGGCDPRARAPLLPAPRRAHTDHTGVPVARLLCEDPLGGDHTPPPETSQALKIGEYDVTILVD